MNIFYYNVHSFSTEHIWRSNRIAWPSSVLCCSYLFWIDPSLKIKICPSVHIPSLQLHATKFFRVFWWEHGGADLRVTTAGNLRPVRVPLAFLRHQLWRHVGWMQRFLLKQAFSLIVLLPWLKTKHFKYLPGSDPRHPLQAGQICCAISQLQSSWWWWWERNHNSAGRKEKVVVLSPSYFFYTDNSCILAQSVVNRRTLSHGEDHHRNSWGGLILEMFWRNSHTEPIQTLVLGGITLYFTWFQLVWLLCVLFLTFTLLQQWCNDRFILYRVERTGGVHHPPSDSQLFHTTHGYSQLQPGEHTLILRYCLTQE